MQVNAISPSKKQHTLIKTHETHPSNNSKQPEPRKEKRQHNPYNERQSPSNNPLNLPPTLRHSTPHLPRQHIPKTRKRLPLPAQILVPALYQLDELARVDVRVARGVDVVDYLGG